MAKRNTNKVAPDKIEPLHAKLSRDTTPLAATKASKKGVYSHLNVLGVLLFICAWVVVNTTKYVIAEPEKEFDTSLPHPGIIEFNPRLTVEEHEASITLDQLMTTDQVNLHEIISLLVSDNMYQHFKSLMSRREDNSVELNKDKFRSNLMGLYGIDQIIAETNFADKEFYRKASRFLNTHTASKPLSDHTPKEIVLLIRKLNSIIKRGVNSPTPLAEQARTVSKFGLGLITQQESNREYLRKNDPESLAAYEYLLSQVGKHNPHTFFPWLATASDRNSKLNKDNPRLGKFLRAYLKIIDNHKKLPKLMEQFANDLLEKLKDKNLSPFSKAAFAHQEIVKLHPFSDGNGRTARLFMNAILSVYGIPPIQFSSNEEYTARFNLDEEEGGEHFANYLQEVNASRGMLVSFYNQMQSCIDENRNREICGQEFEHNKYDLLTCPAPEAKATLKPRI